MIVPYISLFKMKLINMFAYRVSAWSQVFSGAIYGFIQTSIMLAFFTLGNTSNIAMSLSQAVTHMWLVVMLHGVMPYGGSSDIHTKISSGVVAYDLCRPIDLYWLWFTTSMSEGLTKLITTGPGILILVLLLPAPYTFSLPISFLAFLLFLISIGLAMFLATSMDVLISLTYINADMGRGLGTLIYAFIILLSGDLFPLTILTSIIVDLLRLLPFAGLKDTPISIYLGLLSLSEAAKYMSIQILWTIALVLLGKFLLSRYKKSIIIQGG